MKKKWEDIRQKASPEQVEQARQELQRRYDRPWWRVVRFYDRVRGKETI